MNKYNFYFLCDGKAKSFQHNLTILEMLGGSYQYKYLNGVHESLKGLAMYIDMNNQIRTSTSLKTLDEQGCRCVDWIGSTSHRCYYICDSSQRPATWYIEALEARGGVITSTAREHMECTRCYANDTFFYIDSFSHQIKQACKCTSPELFHLLTIAGYTKCLIPRKPRVVQWTPSVKDEVLCRNTDGVWDLCQFAYMTAQGKYSVVGGRQYEQILPYRGATSRFLGATSVPKINYQVNVG